MDEGSAVNVLTLEAFKVMKGVLSDLKQVTKPSVGLGGIPIQLVGTIALNMEVRDRTEGPTKKIIALFNVVDMKLAYNAILGRPFLMI